MMWLSAAKAATTALLVIGLPQSETDSTWKAVQGSFVTVETAGRSVGLGVLVDSRGYFLSHKLPSASVPTGRTASGAVLTLEILAVDEHTQTALLAAKNWTGENAIPLQVARAAGRSGERMLVVTPDARLQAMFVSDQRIGIMNPSLRYVPLTEVRFETTPARLSGGVLINAYGELVGILGATLRMDAERPPDGKGIGGLQFGPKGQTVAFALSPDVTRRVVEGFLSPDRKVRHPAIGIYFGSAGEDGVQIETVTRGSPADVAGLKAGDTIITADSVRVWHPVDLALVLFRQRVGGEVKLSVRQGGEIKRFVIPVVDQDSLG